MALKTAQSRRSRLSPGGQRGRWLLSFLVLLALLLLALGRVDHPAIREWRAWTADATAPALAVLARPVDRMEAGWDWVIGLGSLARRNAQLAEDNARLLQWRDTALALERENARLRALLGVRAPELQQVATARVIGVSGGPFARSITIGAGRNNGVRPDQPVLDARGLVGRVLEAGRHAARALLVTDLNSRVPVLVGADDAPAIARGVNAPMLELLFLPPDAQIAIGDRVETSGAGGVFPPGILLGEVVAGRGERHAVAPVALLDRLVFVRIVETAASAMGTARESGSSADTLPEDGQAGQ